MKLRLPDGTIEPLEYDGHDGYKSTTTLEVGSYTLIINGVDYPLTIKGLKLQRKQDGTGIGESWADAYDDLELQVIEQQAGAVSMMQSGTQVLNGLMDQNWTMLTLQNGWVDRTGNLTVTDPEAVDSHELNYEDPGSTNVRVNVKADDEATVPDCSEVAFQLHKDTADAGSFDFVKETINAKCGSGQVFTLDADTDWEWEQEASYSGSDDAHALFLFETGDTTGG